MFKFLKEEGYRKCYEEHGNNDGWTCYGKWAADDLSEDCCQCPYWRFPPRKKVLKRKLEKLKKEVNYMITTNLGMTKEEIIYQFVISLNKGQTAIDNGWDIVIKAVDEYDELVNQGIIKEEDAYSKFQEQMRKVRENLRGETVKPDPVEGRAKDIMIAPSTTPIWINPEAIETDKIDTEHVNLVNKAGDVVKTISLGSRAEEYETFYDYD